MRVIFLLLTVVCLGILASLPGLPRAFAAEPAVLFADEPTGNLDSHTGSNIMELMFELNRSSSTTLVLVTHDLTLAARCDRILRLDAGLLISDKTGAE